MSVHPTNLRLDLNTGMVYDPAERVERKKLWQVERKLARKGKRFAETAHL